MERTDFAFDFLEPIEQAQLQQFRPELRPQTVWRIICPVCDGTRKTNQCFACHWCKGEGFVEEK